LLINKFVCRMYADFLLIFLFLNGSEWLRMANNRKLKIRTIYY